MDLKAVKEGISEHEVISFDLFGTLLIRPYIDPKDVFRHIERNEKLPGFCRERVRAERSSRARIGPEITYDDIYSEIDKKFRHIKEMELDYERSILKANPEMKQMFRYALENGKKVIVISDMYLPSDFLDRVLNKNGFSGYSKIFVSCEHGCNKASGDLFRVVMNDLGINAESMLHIGDDKRSDLVSPKRIGIDAVWYESIVSQYLSCNKKEHRVYRSKKSLDISILLAMNAMKWKREKESGTVKNYWYDTSYEFGGPIAYSFIRHVKRNLMNDTEKIFFIARDGYNLIKLFDILYGDIFEHSYVYAPRTFRFLEGRNNGDSRNQAYWTVKYFLNDPRVEHLMPNKSLSTRDCVKIYSKNTEIFERLRSEEIEKYKGYMEKVLADCKRIEIVDVTTMEYSSQRLVEYFAEEGSEVIGHYCMALKDSKTRKHSAFHDRSHNFFNWSEVNVTELFMSSPEPPVCGISKEHEPIFRENNSEHELKRISVCDDILRGEIDFVNDLMETFGDKLPEMSSEAMRQWTLFLIKRRSESDRENILKMMWAPDFDHSRYYYLVFSPSDTWHHVKNKGLSVVKRIFD